MGRPKGAWSEKRFRDALALATTEKHESGKSNLRVIAEKLVSCAIAGEGWAICQVGDRLDGKPAQAVTVDANVTHDLGSLTDAELASRIQRELAAIAGRSGEAANQEQLH